MKNCRKWCVYATAPADDDLAAICCSVTGFEIVNKFEGPGTWYDKESDEFDAK